MGVRMAAVALVALSLSGCVAVPPPGPTDDELEAHRAEVLRQTWANSGLPGQPPAVEAQDSSTEVEWIQSVSDCLAERAEPVNGWSYTPDSGYALLENPGVDLDDSTVQLTFYVCVAEYNPPQLYEAVLSDAQLDYIYDYYQDWLVPCVVMQGYRFTDVPTRTEYKAIAGQWSPFYSVDISITNAVYTQLESSCGAERPQLY